MNDLDFFQHLQFKLTYAPFDPDDDDLEKWRKKNRIFDEEIQKAGINNPQLVKVAKKRLLGEAPPNFGVIDGMIEEFVPGIKRGQASTAMSIGGFLGAPGESAYDELQPIFDQGKPLQPWNPFSKRVPFTEEEKKELAEKYVKSGVLDRRKGAFDRPRQPEFLENIGESLYDAGKQYREQINEGIETRAPTEEEYIAQKRKGGPIDQLLAEGVESGYLPVPQQLSRSFGESVSSQLVPATVGGLTALTGMATKSPAMVGAGTGIYRAGSLVAGATQVAGSIGDAIQSDDDIRQLVQEKVESKYDPETIGNPKVQRKIKREVDKEMKRHGMDMASRAVGDRIFSPQALLDYASTYPGGGLLTKFLIDIGAEAGSEGFDSMLEQTMKLNKMEELMRELGYTPEQIEERLTYDTIGGYRVSDWKEVAKGGISGALMEGPVATIEAGVERVVYGKQDKRVERGTQNDRDMQLLKDQAYAQQVQLQERNIVQEGINKETDLEIQREKTEQLRLKNQTGDTAPAVEPILDQQEVQSVYDEANQDTPIAEGVTPNLAPIEQPTMSPQEQADVQALDDQMLNPDVINPLSPEQVAESQQQRTQEIRQNELDLDAQDTLGVNPEDIAPVGPDQTQQEVQEAREELSDAMRQRLELQDYYNQNRQTLEERRSQVETTDQGTTLRSLRDDPDSDTEAIPNPQEEGGASILPEALPQEEVETATEPQSPVLPEQRLSRGVAEAVVSLFRQRFPNLLGEINVFSNEDYSRVRGKNAPQGVEGEYSKGTGYVDILFENIIGRGETQKSATDRLVEVLWHEVLGHKGLIEGLNNASRDGKGYERFIDNVLRDYANDPEFIAFLDYLKEVDPDATDRVGAEEFVVRKFAEGNSFGVLDGQLLERSTDGDFVPANQNQKIFAQGILENKFLDTLIASFKEAIGRDGITKGRLDDRQIRHIMLALKMKAMQSGNSVLNPAFRPGTQTEQDEEMFLDEEEQGIVSEATDDGMFTQEGGPEPQILRSLGRNISVRRSHNWPKQKLRWSFNVGDDTIDVRAGFTSNLNEIVSGRTMTPEGISTFDRLIDKEPEFRQKVESLGIDPSKDVMELSFDRVDPRGESRYDTTGGGDQFSIFSGVAIAGRELMAKQPQTVMFTAEEKVENVPEDREVAGRVRLYDRFADGLAQEFGYDKISHVYEGGLKGVYILNKPQTLQSRRRPITGQDDFARRAVGKRYASPEEFSESALMADKTLNDLQKLDEYDRQMKFREGGRKYLPTRDNPQIREIVDEWLAEREDQKQGQKTKIGELFRRIKQVSDEKITPAHVDKYRNFLRNENKKLRSIRNATAKSRQAFANPVERTPLRELLSNEINHEARARIIKDYGAREKGDVTEDFDVEDVLKSFRTRSANLNPRVSEYDLDVSNNAVTSSAKIEDILGDTHRYEFHAGGQFVHPREVARRGREQEFVDKGFNLDVMMQAYNVMFSIDDSYSIEEWTGTDPNTGEEVKLQIEKPAFSLLKRSLQDLIESKDPDGITFTGSHPRRVEAYDRGMDLLGKIFGYNVVGIGSVDSKSYYMQKKDIADTNPVVPNTSSNSATIQDMAWQFGANMDSVGRDNIEIVLLGNSTEIDLDTGFEGTPTDVELRFQNRVQEEIDLIDVNNTFDDPMLRTFYSGLRQLRNNIDDVYQDLERRKQARLEQENAEKAGSFFVRVANNDRLITQMPNLALPDTFGEYVQSLDDPYNTFFNYGRTQGQIPSSLGYSPELHNVVLNLQQLGNFTWDPTSQRFYALGRRMTPSQFTTYLRSPNENNRTDPTEDIAGTARTRPQSLSAITRFISRQVPGARGSGRFGEAQHDALIIASFNDFTDTEIMQAYRDGIVPNNAGRDPQVQMEYAQNVINNVRAFLAEENRVYDLNEEFAQRMDVISDETFDRVADLQNQQIIRDIRRQKLIAEELGFDEMPLALRREDFARLDEDAQKEEINRTMEEDLRDLFESALRSTLGAVEGTPANDFLVNVNSRFNENAEFQQALNKSVSSYVNLMDPTSFELLNEWGSWSRAGERFARQYFEMFPESLPEDLDSSRKEFLIDRVGDRFFNAIWEGRGGPITGDPNDFDNPVTRAVDTRLAGEALSQEVEEGLDFEPADDPINEPTTDFGQRDYEYNGANRAEQEAMNDAIFSQMESILTGLQDQIEALPMDDSRPFRSLITGNDGQFTLLASFLDQQPSGFLTQGYNSRTWSTWFESMFPNMDEERREFVLYGWMDAVGGARRRREDQNTQQTLRSIRPGVKMVEVHNTNNTANDYQSMFYLPDGSKVEAQSTTSAYPRDITDYLDSDLGQRTVKTLLSQGLNPRKKLQYWNVSFDRDGSTDIMGNTTEQHKVANGIKQYLEQLIVDKVPEGIWFSAYDPGLRAVGDGFEVNPDKIGARIRVYKLGAKALSREYGYTLGLVRNDMENAYFYMQRNDLVGDPQAFENIVENFNDATGKQVTYEYLSNVRRGFDQLVNSLYVGEAGDFVNYTAVKGTIPANFRQSIVQAYDSIPEYLQDGLDADVAGQVVNDLRNNPSLVSDPDITLQSVRNVQPPERNPETQPPTPEESTEALPETGGIPNSKFGRWAHSVMNYLRGKQLGDLKNEEQYLLGRYRALGEIARMTELGQRFYEIFKDAKNPREIYSFLTTQGANPEMIPDARERAVAIEAKDEIIKIGEDLKDLGLLRESTLKAMRGQYLPRIYLTHLLNDETVRTLQGGGRPSPSQLGYLKNRKDLSPVVRELILREIKDPDYLVGRALMIPGRDIALINWFREIAQNPDWAYQPSLVTFDTLQEVENIINAGENAQALLKIFELDPSIKDRREELQSRIKFTQQKLRGTKDSKLKKQYQTDLAQLKEQLKMLKPRKVTGEYLKDESIRLREQIIPTLEGRTKEIGEALAQRMSELAGEYANVAYDQMSWRKMPTTKRFGQLKGMIVRREIYDDIVGSSKVIEEDPYDSWNNLFGEGGTLAKVGQFWKWSKVAGNFPASHVRNFISNLSLMHLGGVPGQSIPGLLKKAVTEMIKNGEHFRIAKKYGLKGSSFSANELGAMEKEFTELKRRLDKGEGNWVTGTFGAVRRGFEGFKEGTSYSYEMMEALGKTMMIIDGMNRLGLSEGDAVLRAQKYLFDYSLLPSWGRKMRQSVSFGSPFFTFYFKTLPVLLETVRERPWKFIPYFLMGQVLHQSAKAVMDIDEEEAEALRMSIPEFLRNKHHVYMLPWRDANNRVVYFDASYLLPWGMFSELLQEISPVNVRSAINLTPTFETKNPSVGDAIRTLGLASGPFLTATAGFMTNKDPFTQRTIWNERDPASAQNASKLLYLWNLATPTMLAGIPDIWMNTDQQRLQGSIRKLYGALNDELNKRGLPKDTVGQSTARFFGINTYGFNPAQAVQDSMYFGRQGLRDAMNDMRIELRNMQRSGKSSKEIDARRQTLMKRIIKEQEKLRKYQQATQKAVAL